MPGVFCWLALENPDLERLAVPALSRALRARVFPGARVCLRVTRGLPVSLLGCDTPDQPWLQLLTLESDERRGRLLAEPIEHWEPELASPALSRALGGHVSLGLLDQPPLAWAAAWKMGRLVRSLHSDSRNKEQKLLDRDQVLQTGISWAIGEPVRLEGQDLLELPGRIESLLASSRSVDLNV